MTTWISNYMFPMLIWRTWFFTKRTHNLSQKIKTSQIHAIKLPINRFHILWHSFKMNIFLCRPSITFHYQMNLCWQVPNALWSILSNRFQLHHICDNCKLLFLKALIERYKIKKGFINGILSCMGQIHTNHNDWRFQLIWSSSQMILIEEEYTQFNVNILAMFY